MKNLVSLGLASNQLRGSIPASLAKLHNLKYLNLCMNSFDTYVPVRLQNRGPTQDFLNSLLKRDRKRDRPEVQDPDAAPPLRTNPVRENRSSISYYKGGVHPLNKGKGEGGRGGGNGREGSGLT